MDLPAPFPPVVEARRVDFYQFKKVAFAGSTTGDGSYPLRERYRVKGLRVKLFPVGSLSSKQILGSAWR